MDWFIFFGAICILSSTLNVFNWSRTGSSVSLAAAVMAALIAIVLVV